MTNSTIQSPAETSSIVTSKNEDLNSLMSTSGVWRASNSMALTSAQVAMGRIEINQDACAFGSGNQFGCYGFPRTGKHGDGFFSVFSNCGQRFILDELAAITPRSISHTMRTG